VVRLIIGVTGDFYAAEWVSTAWRRESMAYTRSTLTASQLYLEALPIFTRGLASLPDHPILLRELRMLERTPTRMGKDQVTHPRNCHDDHANVTAGVLCNLATSVDIDSYRRAYGDWDDPLVTHAVSQLFPSSAVQRAHDELMSKYGGPASPNPIPREFAEEALKAK
jgi:hypothetical protein